LLLFLLQSLIGFLNINLGFLIQNSLNKEKSDKIEFTENPKKVNVNKFNDFKNLTQNPFQLEPKHSQLLLQPDQVHPPQLRRRLDKLRKKSPD